MPADACSPTPAANAKAACLLAAAHQLVSTLGQGRAVDAACLRAAMTAAMGASDAEGAWDWKAAYDACEAAQILFLRKYGAVMQSKAATAPAFLAMLEKLAGLLPTHTRRSEESQAFQQFSTPIGLGFAAATAAAMSAADLVLEPSAGTGLLAIFAERAGAQLALNELAEVRADLLERLFPAVPVTRFDAAHIDDFLETGARPSVVLMNPPFSAGAHVDGRVADAALRHMRSALGRLADGGRLVAITGASLAPDNPAWTDAFAALQERARLVFSALVGGSVYARHGTTMPTRLTVFDKLPAEDARRFPVTLGAAPDAATLLQWVIEHLPPRLPVALAPRPRAAIRLAPSRASASPSRPQPSLLVAADAEEIAYETLDWRPAEAGRLTDALYEVYGLQSLRIPGAQPHPTPLVQSAAMASVAPPKPSYRPHVTKAAFAALSDAQLETVIYAGACHGGHLAGGWTMDATYDQIAAAPEDAEAAVCFRRGFFLGDGTGAGKGRQVAAVILDNWLKGRRRALWISKSDTLIEDAQRDWSALGQERLLIQPLARFRQGTPIRLAEGILFVTYATLRSAEREEKVSRLQQILDWLGRDFDGVIVFDEAHAMANAAGGKGERGDVAPSQQGRAGLRLQHALPDARVLYVSATGATTVRNLAYAQRLGLWGGDDFPFSTRAEFVEAIEAGGVAAMEVVARDLKSLGLYTARSLSFAGIEYELVEHKLSAEQRRIYDTYAGAFEIIHNNLAAALDAANITGTSEEGSKTLNAQAKSAARSAFESTKQRFFGHLLTSMMTPTLIKSIDRDLAAGHAAVVQVVSTGEALMERRLAEIPTSEWNDLSVDLTPREYVLDYLAHSFPTQLFEEFTDDEGNLASRPVWRDGQPVQCREAVERRDRMIEKLASLTPVPGALDQIVHRFGTEHLAEVTGRSRRVVRKNERLAVESRAGSANLAETSAFQDDRKRILVFSEAGGTGRSYHADLGARNRRLRVHYLLEPGWKADAAIQGLGRTNRTNQAQPPLFRPMATDVHAQKRFLSTIARRLDTLGAITRGQRQTGGQGLFRPEDNLESPYGRAALRQFYILLHGGKVEGCTLERFQAATGLSLCDSDGTLKDELPPISQFLNRLLALTIAMQNTLFDVFEALLRAKIEGAVAAGVYDHGVETVVADSLTLAERRTVYTHAATGAETEVFTLLKRERNNPLSLSEVLLAARERGGRLLVNGKSQRAALQVPAAAIMLDDGRIEPRVRLIRPMERMVYAADTLAETAWEEAGEHAFTGAWQHEIAELPAFSESNLYVVTGLLLPIWRRLPNEGCRVYRLQTDDGMRIIGRQVTPDWIAGTLGETPKLAPDEAWRLVLERGDTLMLTEGLTLRRRLVMGLQRIELDGFSDGMVDRFKALGLMSEIIAWKLRLFVPVGDGGAAIIGRVLERHPLTRVTGRKDA
jgi:predicted RNA methylase